LTARDLQFASELQKVELPQFGSELLQAIVELSDVQGCLDPQDLNNTK
jgi:hypothetical protein